GFVVVLPFSLAMDSTPRGGSMFSNVSLLERLSCNIFLTNFPAKTFCKGALEHMCTIWNSFGCVHPTKIIQTRVVKGNGTQESLAVPVMVLEHGSLNFEGDLVLVGCVKDFKTIPNIYNVCSSEGFKGIKSSYLGGFWVLFKFDSFQSCDKFQSRDGINSWFSCLQRWDIKFVISNRIVWIDVE
nr:RNA-directed DNA polymerase, eukaryota [Tanacetum cinerariifolium]